MRSFKHTSGKANSCNHFLPKPSRFFLVSLLKEKISLEFLLFLHLSSSTYFNGEHDKSFRSFVQFFFGLFANENPFGKKLFTWAGTMHVKREKKKKRREKDEKYVSDFFNCLFAQSYMAKKGTSCLRGKIENGKLVKKHPAKVSLFLLNQFLFCCSTTFNTSCDISHLSGVLSAEGFR